MMMILRLNCSVWSRVGRGYSEFEIRWGVVYGEVGETFLLRLYSGSVRSEFSQCPVFSSRFYRIP